MKELVPINEYGIFADMKDTPRVDSRYVAKFFEKNHKEVLRDIRKLTAPDSGLPQTFAERNFAPSSYMDATGRRLPCCQMTREGFTLLVMGYTGKKALGFKVLYIERFNEMESYIKTLKSARDEFPYLTDNIKLIHENPKPYHYSNECDMINRLVLGMSAKKFRELHGIPKDEPIRPHMTDVQISMLERLQLMDAGMMVITPEYSKRKQALEDYKAKLEAQL